MPVSQLTEAINAARAAGFSFTTSPARSHRSSGQRHAPAPQTPVESHERPSEHATSTPIPNSNRFVKEDRSYYPPKGQFLPDDWVAAPVRFHMYKDNITDYYRAGTGGRGWENAHDQQYIERERKILGQFEDGGGLTGVNWNLDDHHYWSKPCIKKKKVLITRGQWKDWIQEQWREVYKCIEEEGAKQKAEQSGASSSQINRGENDQVQRSAKLMESQRRRLHMPDRERRRKLGRQMRLRSYHQEVTGHVEKMGREFISELSKSNNQFPMDVLATRLVERLSF